MNVLLFFVLCLFAGTHSWENPWQQFQNNFGQMQQRIQSNIFKTMDDINKGIHDSINMGSSFSEFDDDGFEPFSQTESHMDPEENIEMVDVPAGSSSWSSAGGSSWPSAVDSSWSQAGGALWPPQQPQPYFNPAGNMFNQMHGMFNHQQQAWNPYGFPGFGGSSVQSSVNSRGDGAFNSYISPPVWWRGPNVCIERSEEDDGDKESTETSGMSFFQFHSSNCQDTEQAYVCTSRVRGNGVSKVHTTKYLCCYGYRRVPGQPGCQQTVELKDMVTTLERLGVNRFTRLVEGAGLISKLRDSNNTVLCPSDDAVLEYQENNEDNEVIRGGRVVRSVPTVVDDYRDMVLHHMMAGFVTVSDLVDEKILLTEKEDVKLRANVYHVPETVYMINCVRVTSVDNLATNGVVHLVDRMIEASTKSVADIIDKDSQFSIFSSLLSQAGLMKDLKSLEGHYTVFAPTDDAFRKLDRQVLENLRQGRGCVKNILKNHIMPHTVCSGAIKERAHARTDLGAYLHIRRDTDDKMFIGRDCQVTARDVVATNGVVHFVDQVLFPSDARSPSSVLVEKNMTAFLDLLEETNLLDTLDTMANITLFAPVNTAVMAIPREVRSNPQTLRNLVMFHLSKTLIFPACGADIDNRLPTALEGKSIHLDTSQSMSMLNNVVTAQCARLVDLNNHACDASIQIVEKVLYPPEGSIPEIVGSSGNLTIVRRLLRSSGLERDLSGVGPYTLLAPTDQAFHNLPEAELNSLLDDPQKAARLLRNHILNNIICCQSANPVSWYLTQQERSLGGTVLTVRRDNYGRVHFADAQVTRCDVMADNGVIHTLNKVVQPAPERRDHAPWFRVVHL